MATMFDDDDNTVTGVCRDSSTVKWLKLATLGKGSYGVVHKVKLPNNSEVGDVFAVKSCLNRFSSSLRKEVETLKHLRGCMNVVECYGYALSLERGVGYVYNLVLEFAPRGTLSDLIRNKYGGDIPESHVKYYTTMLLLALCDIHDKGYIHCDLKPENILVYPSQYSVNSICGLKIADFGLARRVGEKVDYSPMVQRPTFVGTPVYMPYEGMNAESVSPCLDIWSLGCVVVEMITGNRPWKYNSMADLVRLIKTSTPEIPHYMSSQGKDFLSKCLARNPSQRWTAQMLLSHPFLFEDSDPMPLPPAATTNSAHMLGV